MCVWEVSRCKTSLQEWARAKKTCEAAPAVSVAPVVRWIRLSSSAELELFNKRKSLIASVSVSAGGLNGLRLSSWQLRSG